MSAFGVRADIGCLLFESEAFLRHQCLLLGAKRTLPLEPTQRLPDANFRFRSPLGLWDLEMRLSDSLRAVQSHLERGPRPGTSSPGPEAREIRGSLNSAGDATSPDLASFIAFDARVTIDRPRDGSNCRSLGLRRERLASAAGSCLSLTTSRRSTAS